MGEENTLSAKRNPGERLAVKNFRPPRTFASMDWDSTELGRESFVILECRFDVDEEYWMELETDDLYKYGGVELIMEDDERTTNVTRGFLF
jgi:hypothetical protein